MAKAYSVLSIDELVRPSETGGISRYHRIRIKTTAGVIRTVDIGESDLVPEKAGPILEAAAKEADGVMSL